MASRYCHLILVTELLGFDAEKWAAFNVIIQLGAIDCATFTSPVLTRIRRFRKLCSPPRQNDLGGLNQSTHSTSTAASNLVDPVWFQVARAPAGQSQPLLGVGSG